MWHLAPRAGAEAASSHVLRFGPNSVLGAAVQSTASASYLKTELSTKVQTHTTSFICQMCF
jgi:hypothetical protein